MADKIDHQRAHDLQRLCNLKYWEIAQIMTAWQRRSDDHHASIEQLGHPDATRDSESPVEFGERIALGILHLSREE